MPRTVESDPEVISTSPTFELWAEGLKPSTREVYCRYLRRLFKDARVTPDAVLDAVKKDVQAYVKLTQLANKFTERGRHITVFALRRFLYDNGVLMLPPARIRTPTPVKEPTHLTWEQAETVILAASRPYNIVFKLMLHCAWGLGEFMRFNNDATWSNVKTYLTQNPQAEYYRHDFRGRKKNGNRFYTLVPTSALKEVLSLVPVPIRASHGYIYEGERRTHKTSGILLDSENYHSARVYLEKAWITGRKRAAASIKGQPSVHELRDTFRTRATEVRCAAEAAEFAMGHSIDPLNYNKCYYDEKWMWTNLSKIYGPVLVTDTELEALRQKVRILEQDHLTREQIIEIFRDFMAKQS